MGSALSCISPAPNATKSSTHEAAPSVPAAADPEAKSELPSNASNAAVKPVAIKDAQATAIGAENAAAQMQPTGTPPATKSDASPHAGATTTARDLPTAVESVFNIEGGGKLTDFAGVKSTGTEPALFAHAPIVMTSLPLSTCPADGTGGSPVGTSNTVGFVNASNVTSAVPVPTQTQLDPHKKPPTPAADAGGASFSSTADSPGLGTSPFPTQTQLDPHKKPPAPSADAGGASFSATVAGAGTSPFPTQTQLDPHKKPPTPAADAGGASFSATVAGAGAGCSRAKAGPSFGAIDLDTVVSTTSTSVQQSGTFADTANVSASIGGGDGDASGIGSSTTHTYTSPFTDTANASASIGGGGGDASGIGSSTAPTCTSPLTPAAGSEHNVEPDVSATAQPNASATAQPDVSATAQPDVSATTQTVVSATAEPNASATAQPDVLATAQPDVSATAQPDVSATAKPDVSATAQPDVLATAQPHVLASAQPDVSATAQPDVSATARPDVSATAQPDVSATAKPDVSATAQPDVSATAQPDVSATAQPDVSATAQPDVSATAQPDVSATAKPDVSATAQPDVSATAKPDVSATAQPDVSATAQPDVSATAQPDVSAAATYTTSSAPIPIARQANFSTGPPPAPIPMAKQADFSTGPPAAPIPTAKEVDISTGTPIRSGATTNPYGGHNSTGSCNSGCVSSEGWSSMLSPAVNAEATGARGGDADATGARGGDAEDTGARGGDAEATGARGGDAEATGARGGDAEATGASGADAEASGARGGDAEANGASGADAEASGARGGDADATGASGANAEACGASGANAEACGASGNDTAPSGAAAAVETASEGRKEKMVTADSAFAGQVQEEGKVHAAASPKGSGHAQGPSKASSMFPFFSARRIRKRGIPLPSITQIFGNMSSVFASFGAITVADVSFGLKVIQSRHHKTKPPSFKAEPESSHMAGARVVGPREALNILDDLDLASGAYKTSAKAMCAATRLKLQNIKFWSSNGSFIRPAMYIAVCHIKNELIVGVRGTKAFLDLVINMCGAPHETPLGHTHWGMHQAAEVLLNDHVDLLEELARGEAKGYTLKFVGHSLGAGVAALMAFIVLNKPELKDRVVGEDAVCGIVATCFAPPSVTDPNLSESLKEVVTSVVMDQDIVPRISCRTMANLVSELAVLRKDWTPEGQTEEDSKNAEDRITEARMHQVSSWSTFPGMITQLHVPAVAVMPNLAEVNPTFKKFQQVMQPLHEVASYLLSSDLVQRWCRVFSRQVGAKKEIPSLNVDGASIQEEQGGGPLAVVEEIGRRRRRGHPLQFE